MSVSCRCLVLDHDDTSVMSTPVLHYPSFIKALELLRPERASMSLEDFVRYNFEPGFAELCSDILCFTEEERQVQYGIWLDYVKDKPSPFYPGFWDMLTAFKAQGGLITVVSHSEAEKILFDYRHAGDLLPDAVFGWDFDEAKRKPSPWPLQQIMERFHLHEDDLLVLDDLKQGLLMARAAGVRFACAGWSHVIPEMVEYMKGHSDYYFDTVASFACAIQLG